MNLKLFISLLLTVIKMFKYRSETKIKKNPNTDSFLFQALDWRGIDLDMNEDSDSESDDDKKKYKKKNFEYVIKVYGVSREGYSTCLYIKEFQPFFYLRIPNTWTMSEVKKLKARLTSDVYYRYQEDIVDLKIVKRKELYFFQNNEESNFVKLTFKTYGAFMAYRKLLEKPIKLKSVFGEKKINMSKVSTGFGLYEAKLDPTLRFIHLRDLSAAGWIIVKQKKWSRGFDTHCQMEGIASWKDLYPVESHDISPMLVLSFDIECISEDGSFPDPERENDMVIQIGSTIHRSGEPDVCLRHIVTLGKCNPIDGAVVECYDTEKQLLRGWCKFINKVQPDIMTGYNIWGFDWKFLWKRCERLKCQSIMTELGKHRSVVNKFEADKKLASSALGQNFLNYLDVEGLVQIDLMKLAQRDFKLESYKLDAVAKHFMGQQKEDLSPKQLFANYKKGDPESLKEIATYCIQDNVLCNNLIIKLSVIPNNLGMANVCSVPFTYLFIRGQGVKLFSLVAKRCKQEGVLVPTIYKDDVNPDSYEGAIVFIPEPKIHYNPVAVLDYASLYPSCMIAEDISHDTLVCFYEYGLSYNDGDELRKATREEILAYSDKEFEKVKDNYVRGPLDYKFGREELLNLDDYNYNKITYDILIYKDPESPEKGKRKVGEKDCIYATAKNGTKGIMPRILVDLLNARRTTRSKIKFKTVTVKSGVKIIGLLSEDGDNYVIKTEFDGKKTVKKESVDTIEDTYSDFMKSILDGLQLAYKVVCNSLYGQTGATTSPICLKELAASTTAAGRGMVLLARREVLKNFPKSECVYGDSVTAETPVLMRRGGEKGVVEYMKISDLADSWSTCVEDGKEEKEFCRLEGVEAWSDAGWTPVRNVIRHKLASHKKVFRIVTHTSVVDVTDDHSLLKPDGVEIKPIELMIGDKLLQNPFVDDIDSVYNLDKDEAKIMGFFFGDGSCGKYYCKSGVKSSWALNNNNYEMLKLYQTMCEKVYPDYSWKILDTLESSGVYKLVPQSNKKYGKISEFCSIYRSLFYDGKNKVIPDIVFKSSIESRKAFFMGLYDADGDKCKYCTRIDQKSMISCANIVKLGKSIGYNVSVNSRESKPDIFRITFTTKKQRKVKNAIKKMYSIDYSGYVYDLTTENHHFQAGIGSIIVHNTDSVFIDFTPYLKEKHHDWQDMGDEEKIKLTIHAGEAASDEVQKVIKDPHVLEYEKIFYPFAIFTKKRYFGNKYEFDPKKFKQTSMGIALKRRDYAPIVKEIYAGVINIILNEREEDKIKYETVQYFRKMVEDLLEGNISMNELTITKSLRADYANPTTISHKMLADRMGKRDPGNKPASNDRIPYCFIDIKNLRCYHKECNKRIINTKNCKCRGCMELFCGLHLKTHDCEIVCRYCRIPLDRCSYCIHGGHGSCSCNVKECKTCLGWYCPEHMLKHDQVVSKKTGEVDYTKHKCKKPLDLKMIQGDMIEHPGFIKENDWLLDYRGYLDRQISKPILQIFSLMVDDPNQILRDILVGDDNKKSGMKSITSYFGSTVDKTEKKPLILKSKGKSRSSKSTSVKKEDSLPKPIKISNFTATKQMNLDDMLRSIKGKRKKLKEKKKEAEKKAEKEAEKKAVNKDIVDLKEMFEKKLESKKKDEKNKDEKNINNVSDDKSNKVVKKSKIVKKDKAEKPDKSNQVKLIIKKASDKAKPPDLNLSEMNIGDIVETDEGFKFKVTMFRKKLRWKEIK